MQTDLTHDDDIEDAGRDPSFAAEFEIIRGNGEDARSAQTYSDGRDYPYAVGRLTVSVGGPEGGVTLWIAGDGAEVWARVNLDEAAARELGAAITAQTDRCAAMVKDWEALGLGRL